MSLDHYYNLKYDKYNNKYLSIKQSGGGCESLRILTINELGTRNTGTDAADTTKPVFFSNSAQKIFNKSKYDEWITKHGHEFDVIMRQEVDTEVPAPYNCTVVHNGVLDKQPDDVVGAFVKTSILQGVTKFHDDINNEKDHPNSCPTQRFGLVLTVKLGSTNIKIANVHLCGGRIDDKPISQKLTEGTALDELLKRKLRLLKSALEEKPDIIVGDFNSDIIVHYTHNTDAAHNKSGQYAYFRGIFYDTAEDPLTEDQIKLVIEWNSAAYKLLEENNYIHSGAVKYNKGDDGKFDHEKHGETSLFGAIVDSIWYKKDTFIQIDYKVHKMFNSLNIKTSLPISDTNQSDDYGSIAKDKTETKCQGLTDHNAVEVLLTLKK
jgi:hypothetical protein